MAIARVTSVNGGHGASPFTSANITVNSGEVLVVGVSMGSFQGDTVTSVVWNGGAQTMTQAVKALVNSGGNWGYLYYLANPTAGTNSVTVTAGVNNYYVVMGTYSGVKTSGQPSATSSATTAGASLTDTITTVDDNSWTILLGNAFAGTPTAGAGLTLLQLGDFSFMGLFDSNGAVTPANAYGQTWTATSDMGDVSIALSPPSGAPPALMAQACL